jgi:hypothetical protein
VGNKNSPQPGRKSLAAASGGGKNGQHGTRDTTRASGGGKKGKLSERELDEVMQKFSPKPARQSVARFWTFTALYLVGVTVVAFLLSFATIFIVGVLCSIVLIGAAVPFRMQRMPAGTPSMIAVMLYLPALALAITCSFFSDKLYLAAFGDTGTGTHVASHAHKRGSAAEPTYTCTIHTPAGVAGITCPPGDPVEGWQGNSYRVVYDPMAWVNAEYTDELDLTGLGIALGVEIALTAGLIGAGVAYGLARRGQPAPADLPHQPDRRTRSR